MSSRDGAPDDGRSASEEALAVVKAVTGRGRSFAGAGASAVSGGVDDALRALVARRVDHALRPGAAEVSTDELLDALVDRSGSSFSPWLGAGAARLVRTGRVARALGGRTPLGLIVRFGPALYTAVSSNLRGLDAAAGRLATRARGRKIDPDPERLRRAVVQALTGAPVDPDADADHSALLRVWLGEAGRRAVPFGDHIKGLRASRTPEAVAAVLDSIDVARLGRR